MGRPKKMADRSNSDSRRASSESSRALLEIDGDHWKLKPNSTSSAGSDQRLVPALDNAISIIRFLNASAPEAVHLAALATQFGISRSHCFNILKTLVFHDWLNFDQATKTYRLQSGLLGDVCSLLNQSISMTRVQEILTPVALSMKLPFVLSQPLSDDSFVVLARFSAPGLLEVSLPVGHRIPRNAFAEMRAYLAWQSDERINRWFERWEPISYTASTLTDQDAIRSEIAATRRRGYARSINEFTEGLAALALPIFNREGAPHLILNCCAPLPVMQQREAMIARELISTVDQIHREIGGTLPYDFPRANHDLKSTT